MAWTPSDPLLYKRHAHGDHVLKCLPRDGHDARGMIARSAVRVSVPSLRDVCDGEEPVASDVQEFGFLE